MGNVQRRTFLAAAVVTGTGVSLPLATPAAAAEETIRRLEQQRDQALTGMPSPNGWEMEKLADGRGNIHTRPVPGTPLQGVQMRIGAVDAVLAHVIHRFHCEVDELQDGDVVGWRPLSTVRRSLPECNQASGTAVKIRPGHCPAGSRGGFFAPQLAAVRGIVADLGGVVRWGGDDRSVDEALFYIDVKPGDQKLMLAAQRIRPL